MSELPERIDVDVVVIGAGFAGLVAARELGRLGATCVVLEARDRCGGRTWVGPALGGDYELGGGWVHWLQPHLWAELRRYGIGLADPKPVDVGYTWFGGSRTRESSDALHERLFEAMRPLEEAARAVFPLPYEPFARREAVEALDGLDVPGGLEALGVARDMVPLLSSYWGANVSGPATAGGVLPILRWIALSGWDSELIDEAAGTYTIEGGTAALIDAIRGDVNAPVLLDEPVARIEHGPDGVTVTARGCTVRARAAIVTAPIGALAGIVFDPPLDGARARAAATGQASCGVKAWVRIAGRGERFLAMLEDGSPLTHLAVDREDGDSRILVVFGPDARTFDASPAAVQATLALCVPDAVVEEVAWHDWIADPWARQTWLWTRPGQFADAYLPFRETSGSLVFAGADYADGWAGFMDGAIESGLRVSQNVAERIT